jgi:subtilase family serine protease
MQPTLRKTPVLSGALIAFLLGAPAVAQNKLQQVTQADKTQVVQFSVFLPLQNSSQLDQLIADLHNPASPNYRQWLSPQAFRAQFGAKSSDLAQVESVLADYGITVLSTSSHGLQAQGPVSAVENAVGASLWNATGSNGRPTLISTSPLQMPAGLAQVGAQVVSFSPVVRVHPHAHISALTAGRIPQNRFSPVGGYFFDDLKQAYVFPSYKVLSGKGRAIGIVDSGDFLDSDIALYFGYENTKPPEYVRVPIDGGNPNTSAETELDLEQAGGMALDATIYLYNIPNLSDQSILDAYTAIVEDNNVDIVSSSFGGAEGFYTAAYNDGVSYTYILQIYDDIFRQGNAQGITFLASSGDNAAFGLPSLSYLTATRQTPPVVTAIFLPGIETPASDPHVTAVGGTNLVTTYDPPSLLSEYISENAWPDPLVPYDPYGVGNLVAGGLWGSGSGPSIIFSKPDYQFQVNTGSFMRTIPDVSLMMGGCPDIAVQPCGPDRSFLWVALDGEFHGFVGTSCSSPATAGVLALEEQNLGHRLGNVNYQIYDQIAEQTVGSQPPTFHTGIPGFNGINSTTLFGYDPVLGARTPFVKNFIFAPNAPSAGTPQTPSNP